MMRPDPQQQRLLERLRRAGGRPVTFAELRADGIHFPAATVAELELNGYSIERVHDHARMIGVRLTGAEPTEGPAGRTRRRHRWPYRHVEPAEPGGFP